MSIYDVVSNGIILDVIHSFLPSLEDRMNLQYAVNMVGVKTGAFTLKKKESRTYIKYRKVPKTFLYDFNGYLDWYFHVAGLRGNFDYAPFRSYADHCFVQKVRFMQKHCWFAECVYSTSDDQGFQLNYLTDTLFELRTHFVSIYHDIQNHLTIWIMGAITKVLACPLGVIARVYVNHKKGWLSLPDAAVVMYGPARYKPIIESHLSEIFKWKMARNAEQVRFCCYQQYETAFLFQSLPNNFVCPSFLCAQADHSFISHGKCTLFQEKPLKSP